MCGLILVTLQKRRPHYSQSSRENATPSSSTSPLASYKEVPLPLPPPPTGEKSTTQQVLTHGKGSLLVSMAYFLFGRKEERYARTWDCVVKMLFQRSTVQSANKNYYNRWDKTKILIAETGLKKINFSGEPKKMLTWCQ